MVMGSGSRQIDIVRSIHRVISIRLYGGRMLGHRMSDLEFDHSIEREGK